MEALLAEHRDFTERVLERGRRALGGVPVSSWLAGEAETIARLGRRRSYIALNPELRSELNIAPVAHPEHRDLFGQGRRRDGWTASINTSSRGHHVSVIRANGLEHIRALEAHEFGHVMVQRHPQLWRAIGGDALLVDKCIERLVDDAARALLLPQSLLGELFGTLSNEVFGDERVFELWTKLSKISRAAILPSRFVASRMASALVEREAILFCYTVPRPPRQGSLFDRTEISIAAADGSVTIGVPWMMAYRRHPDHGQRYVFADRVGKSRKILVRPEGLEQIIEGGVWELSSTMVRKLAGRRGWESVKGAARHSHIGKSILNDREEHFVLCY